MSQFNIKDQEHYTLTTGVHISVSSELVKAGRLMEVVNHHGIILSWFSSDNATASIKNVVQEGYGFPVYWATDGEVTSDMEFKYAGDAPLKPLIVVYHEKECLVLYRYGLCAIVNEDKSYIWGRVD